MRLFGAVIDGSYRDREQHAYEEVMHKFDEMLARQARDAGVHERGIEDDRWIKGLWSNFDAVGSAMHGLIHVHRGFRARSCSCPPCESRSAAV
jgi:hypothetical protein